ncbi:hypothetical protein Tco_0635220, partial [Tanacetum coccineum]
MSLLLTDRQLKTAIELLTGQPGRLHLEAAKALEQIDEQVLQG